MGQNAENKTNYTPEAESSEPLKIYLQEIGQIPVLDEEEENWGEEALRETRLRENGWRRET